MPDKRNPKFFYGYIIVAASFLIALVAGGALFSYGVFFKPLSTQFDWTRTMTSGAYSLFMVLNGLFSIVTGRLNDRFGPRVVVGACGLFLGLGYLLMSQITVLWHLYLYYGVVVALGTGGIFIPIMSVVARWFVKRRGIMTGITTAGVGVGTMIMPPVSQWLVSTYGWEMSFVIIGILALVIIVPATQFLRYDPSQMGLKAYGAEETKVGDPKVETKEFSLKQALRAKQLWLLIGTLFCFFFAIQVIMVHIVPHVTDLGISKNIAASMITVIGSLNMAGRIIMGNTSDRIGIKRAFIIGISLMLASQLWLLVAKDIWMLYLFAAVFGAAFGSVASLPTLIVAEFFGLRSHGVILGTAVFGGTVGGAIGPIVAGYIFDIMGSYQLVFLILVVFSVVGLILISTLRPTSSKGGNK